MCVDLLQSLIRALLIVFLLAAGGDVCAQDLVPVTGRRAVTWKHNGRSSISPQSIDVLPTPVSQQQENNDDPLNFSDSPSDRADRPVQETAGRTEVIRQRYPDGRVQVERQVMQDAAGNFLNHGEWKLYNQRGQVLANGMFEHGLLQGSWQRYHPAGSPGLFSERPFDQFQAPFQSVTTFNRGKQEGVWTIFDQYQRKVIEIPYSNGKRHGRAIWYWPNSIVMREMNFREGQLHGELVEYDQQSEETRRTMYDGGHELITRRNNYHRNQLQAEYSYLGPKLVFNGEDDWWNAEPVGYDVIGREVQHGPSREWYSNGQLKMQGQFRQDVRHGPFDWWHENGQRQSAGTFDQGARTGRWTWWHPNGIKAIEGNYSRDNAEGVWTWWDERGEIIDQDNMSGFDLESLDALEELDVEPLNPST